MMLRNHHDYACRMGEAIMREHGSISPSFFLVPLGGRTRVLPTPWRNSFEKPMYIIAVQAVLDKEKMDWYSFVTEAWLAKVDVKLHPELMNVSPRERSDREDVMLVMTRHRSGENYATKYRVDYTPAGEALLRPGEEMTGDFGGGLMDNLFEEEEEKTLQ